MHLAITQIEFEKPLKGLVIRLYRIFKYEDLFQKSLTLEQSFMCENLVKSSFSALKCSWVRGFVPVRGEVETSTNSDDLKDIWLLPENNQLQKKWIYRTQICIYFPFTRPAGNQWRWHEG